MKAMWCFGTVLLGIHKAGRVAECNEFRSLGKLFLTQAELFSNSLYQLFYSINSNSCKSSDSLVDSFFPCHFFTFALPSHTSFIGLVDVLLPETQY